MKVYTEEVVCSICGGPGVARPRDAAMEWLGVGLRHSDPEVCARYLKRKKRALEQREAELNQQVAV